jgi:biotin carboxyl carrier protein
MTERSGQSKRVEVRAPMSGVFYRKPTPDDPPYVEVGTTVKKKQVLALLETMKVFQKVKSPASGKIVEIIPQNESALKDNDLMFVIEENR